MIKSLSIKNFAIIKEMKIPFNKGLTVITGETGSGKSIILAALGMSIGGKSDKYMIRNGEEKSEIETCFNKDIIRRIIYKNGKTKAYFNNEPLTLTNLKKHKDVKIDFHGQNDQQKILNPETHIDYLDRYCGHEDKVKRIKEIFIQINILNQKLENFKKNIHEKTDQIELLNFQANEIDSVNPKKNEDVILDKRFKRLYHLKEIITAMHKTNYILFDKENSTFSQIDSLKNLVTPLGKYDSDLNKITTLLDNSTIQLQEVQSEVFDQLSKIELRPEELQSIEERLSAIENLKRKYGGTLALVEDKRKSIKKELDKIKNPKNEESQIINDIKILEKIFNDCALELHENRKEIASSLSSQIQKTMENLNMPGSVFKIKVTKQMNKSGFVNYNENFYAHNSKGIDTIEFYLSANPGEPPKPLSLIASGGEVSRIMLAIKTVFEKVDPVETLIFDEIDSGISGNAAKKVASHLVELSKTKQIFCITHLSQIAMKANNHLHIKKMFFKESTSVDFEYLEGNDRLKIMKELFIGEFNG